MTEPNEKQRFSHIRQSGDKYHEWQADFLEGTIPGRSWRKELDLPKDRESLEALAGMEILAGGNGLSSRYIRFVLMDQSTPETRDAPQLQPEAVRVPHTCPLELGHSNLPVGFVYAFIFGYASTVREIPTMCGFEIPENLTGDFIIGQARFFESALARKAWQGIMQGTFTHVCHSTICPALQNLPMEERSVIEVSLTTDDSHSYQGARIIAAWEM